MKLSIQAIVTGIATLMLVTQAAAIPSFFKRNTTDPAIIPGVIDNNTNQTNTTDPTTIPGPPETNTTQTNITQTNITQTNITQTNITQTNITQTNITQTNITQTNITQTNITQTNITQTNITQTNITQTNITQTNITQTNITQTNITLTATFRGSIKNNCGFATWVSSADCYGNADTPVNLGPGGRYNNPFIAHPDGCSQTMKVANNPNNRGPYQIEYNVKPDGKIWYNLSAVDGSPYVAFRRVMEIWGGSGCKNIVCVPGQTSCDWPFMEGCQAGPEVHFTLC